MSTNPAKGLYLLYYTAAKQKTSSSEISPCSVYRCTIRRESAKGRNLMPNASRGKNEGAFRITGGGGAGERSACYVTPDLGYEREAAGK